MEDSKRVKTPTEHRSQLRMLAYAWHGGGGSPLYQYASTGAVVHSAEHREKLIDEINLDIEIVESDRHHHPDDEKQRLEALLAAVRRAPLNATEAPFPSEDR